MNSLLGNEAAVMLGDYLLSSAFLLCSTIKNPELNLLLGRVTNTLCAGEVVQLTNRNNVRLTLEQYYQIIHNKTASLISACCEMGGLLGGGNENQISSLVCFGERVGTAFLIKDDLLDLLEERERVGKGGKGGGAARYMAGIRERYGGGDKGGTSWEGDKGG